MEPFARLIRLHEELQTRRQPVTGRVLQERLRCSRATFKDPALSAEDVVAHCKENLTGYKVPKLVEFREDLPKTNVGKILRRELRD